MDLFLILLMSLDTLLACLACTAQGIHIPRPAAAVIAAVGTGCLGLSFLLSGILTQLLPPDVFRWISGGALVLIALLCLFNESARRISARLAARCHPVRLRLCGLVLEIYAETEKADQDHSGALSPLEALVLSLPLSLDSLLTGLSIVVTPSIAPVFLAFSFVCGLCAVMTGKLLGRHLRHSTGQLTGMVSGGLLLLIAFFKCRM